MLQNTWKSMVMAGLLAGVCTGCSSLPVSTVRAQSPEQAQMVVQEQEQEQAWKASSGEIQQVGGVRRSDHPLHGEVKGAIHNHMHGEQVTRHGYSTPIQGGAAVAPNPHMGYAGGVSPYRNWGNFDQQPCPVPGNAGFGKYPPHHQELGWDHGGHRHAGQYHYHTYSYKQPNNLVYPAPNQPAGAVSYPYYTHKGPSDFFWKGDGF